VSVSVASEKWGQPSTHLTEPEPQVQALIKWLVIVRVCNYVSV